MFAHDNLSGESDTSMVSIQADGEGRVCYLRLACFVQVELLDSRRSLNMGIFLRQFRASVNAHAELVGRLSAGDSEAVGAERLRALLKSLPDDDDMAKVLGYSGDPSRLGPAETFCRHLATALPK